jgi:hypothetical protein
MSKSPQFNSEYNLLKNDRIIYEKELANKNICEIISNFKLFNQEKSIEEVKALLYNQPSESSLIKYWARDNGFIFTLIPQVCDGLWDNVVWKPVGFSGKPNRVIISVPPDSNFNLKTLAIHLERVECEYERRILGDSAELKRTRTVVRNGYENEKWVTNNDPWYDGSSANHTIVDSPSSLSFLSTKLIKTVAENLTEKDVTNVQIKIIYPIIRKKDKINTRSFLNCFPSNNINIYDYTKNQWILTTETICNNDKSKNVTGCLFDYTKEILNLDEEVKSKKIGAVWYRNTNKFHLQVTKNEHTKDFSVIISDDVKLNSNSYEVTDAKIISFPSKIDFLILSVDIPGISLSSDIPEILRGISFNFEKDLKIFLNTEYLICKEPSYFIFAEYNRNKFTNIDTGYDAFAICSFMNDTIPMTDGSNEKNFMENMLLRVNASTVFGISRNCSVLVTMSTQKSTESLFIKAYKESLNGQWLYELILAMHQHWKMVSMKTMLGTSHIDKRGNLSKLRSELVEFTANACFTQVTSDPIGAELYNRWKKILTLNDLNNEVSTQIESLDENSRSVFERTVTYISFIFFPLFVILNIIDVFHLSINDPYIIDNILKVTIIVGFIVFSSFILIRLTNKK